MVRRRIRGHDAAIPVIPALPRISRNARFAAYKMDEAEMRVMLNFGFPGTRR